jgi:dCMP deaminase
MDVAYTFASRSTCLRLQVGCVFSLDGRILVTGYNGAPAGMDHCHPMTCNKDHPCLNTMHAEANAIAFAARHGVQLQGSTLYVTNSPCRPCAMLLINVGVEKVVYAEKYRDTSGINMLEQAKIPPYYLPEVVG